MLCLWVGGLARSSFSWAVVAGTIERVGAGVGVMVGDTSPNVCSMLEHQWWVN